MAAFFRSAACIGWARDHARARPAHRRRRPRARRWHRLRRRARPPRAAAHRRPRGDHRGGDRAPGASRAASRGRADARPRRPRSSAPRPRRAGSSACAPGWPGRRARSARACSPCSAAPTSTTRRGRSSRTPCSPPTSASDRRPSWSTRCAPACGSRASTIPSGPRPRCATSSSASSVRASTARWRATGSDGKPGVVLVVGVNGTGKTTTVGRLARVLVADGKSVVLGAADTFRAAAADQLQTWGERVGVDTVRGPEGGDPASVGVRGRAERASMTAPTSCSWTPRAGCTPRPG